MGNLGFQGGCPFCAVRWSPRCVAGRSLEHFGIVVALALKSCKNSTSDPSLCDFGGRS